MLIQSDPGAKNFPFPDKTLGLKFYFENFSYEITNFNFTFDFLQQL